MELAKTLDSINQVFHVPIGMFVKKSLQKHMNGFIFRIRLKKWKKLNENGHPKMYFQIQLVLLIAHIFR